MNLKPIPEDPTPYVLAIGSAASIHMGAYRRLTKDDVAEIREWLTESGASLRAIGQAFGVSHVVIWKIKHGLLHKVAAHAS